MKEIITNAPGKCILFGEHSVVYGYPSIAMAISLKSNCIIKQINTNKIIINLENYNEIFEALDIINLIKKVPQDYHQIVKCFQLFSEKFNINLENIEIIISSELFPSSGLGSSASIAVALTYALNLFFNLNLNRAVINEMAYELETIIHGTPSGIDNTICTYGKAIFFENGVFDFIRIPQDLSLLITYSNMKHDTKKAIERIRDFKKDKPEKVNELFKKIGEITNQAKIELKRENMNKLGELMNLNQSYLEKLHVSNEIMSEITKISNKNGAFGSKLTGAGLGGCVISLGKKEILIKISSILEDFGYKSFTAKNDPIGVRSE